MTSRFNQEEFDRISGIYTSVAQNLKIYLDLTSRLIHTYIQTQVKHQVCYYRNGPILKD